MVRWTHTLVICALLTCVLYTVFIEMQSCKQHTCICIKYHSLANEKFIRFHGDQGLLMHYMPYVLPGVSRVAIISELLVDLIA